MLQVGFSELIVIGLAFLFLADKETFPQAIKKAREVYSQFMNFKNKTLSTVEAFKTSITEPIREMSLEKKYDIIDEDIEDLNEHEREVYIVGNDGKKYKAYVIDHKLSKKDNILNIDNE